MSETRIPDFAVLLGPFIQKIPAQSQPAFLAALERGAALRYREWAKEVPEHEKQLLGCAEREEDIARRVEELFPADDAGQASIASVFPEARSAYFEVFASLSPQDQWCIQASAAHTSVIPTRKTSSTSASPRTAATRLRRPEKPASNCTMTEGSDVVRPISTAERLMVTPCVFAIPIRSAAKR